MTRRHGIATDVTSSSYERRRKISTQCHRQWRVKTFFVSAFFLVTVLFLVRCAILLQSLKISTLSDYMVAQRLATSAEIDVWENDPERAPFLAILRQAGYDLKEPSLWNNKTMGSLPKWSEVEKSFGSKPKIYGLETCQQFQQTSRSFERHIGVAGMFNSGTNLLSSLLASNCQNQARIDRRGVSATGMEWQGKRKSGFGIRVLDTNSNASKHSSTSLGRL
jgi:hypothetical protein